MTVINSPVEKACFNGKLCEEDRTFRDQRAVKS